MKKTVMLAALLSIISSSALFCGNDMPISKEGKDMPIASHEGKGMPIKSHAAKGAPIMGQKKAKLKDIKELASKIAENPKSARNKGRAKKIMRLVEGLL